MTSQTKASTAANLDLSGLVDGTGADAIDVSTPLTQAQTAVDRARSKVSVTANDLYIKELNDAIVPGTAITKAVLNSGADEQLQINVNTSILALDGSQITSGTIDLARIPTMDVSHIPTLTNSKISDRALTEITGFTQLSGTAASITVNPPSGYDHLLLVASLRTNQSAVTDGVSLRFNSDSTAANYYGLGGNIAHNSVVSTAQNLGAAGQFTLRTGAVGDTGAINLFSVVNIWIYNYLATGFGSNRRIMFKYDGYTPNTGTGDLYALMGGGHYLASAALTAITLLPGNGTLFAIGSHYALYGIG